ncbi:MAG TPA: hypothetical protein PK306_02160, partial [Aquabacterium sp.]|nr:hypothetical protein [Aquabacterium sp.]
AMPIANIPLVRLGAASGTQRTVIDTETARTLREANLLVEESHRVRPRWFDGKFLAARDLTREQAYFLARQAGFARGLGAGVVEGLDVAAGSVGTELRVGAGFGTTSAGELVALTGEVRVSLAQLFTLQTLAQQLGTARRPAPPLRNRTGVFVLGLRPLEFAANPVAAYPTSLDAQRVVEAGDIVEASALTLHHLRDAPAERLQTLRGDLAREVFVQQAGPALPAEVLPIAVLALAGDQVLWIDTHLVRRRAGQAHADVLGFGFAPRLLREAHLAQYRSQLADVMARPLGARPSAAAWFAALPPAGPLPAAAIDARDFSQSWLPPGVSAELTLVPEDEIPVLVEESLTLPPIDLSLTAAEQASTSVAILVPVPREALAARVQALQQRLTRPLVAPATKLVARRTPADTLKLLQTARLVRTGIVPVSTVDPADAAWAALLSTTEVLWYARRRSVALRPEQEGVAVVLRSDGPTPDAIVDSRFDALGVADRVSSLLDRSDSLARAEVVKLLAAEKFASPLLAQTALAQLEARVSANKTLDQAAVAEVAATLNAPGVADGLATLEAARPDLVADAGTVAKLAASEQLVEVGRTLSRATGFEAQKLADEIKLARGKLNLDRVLAVRAGVVGGTVKPG